MTVFVYIFAFIYLLLSIYLPIRWWREYQKRVLGRVTPPSTCPLSDELFPSPEEAGISHMTKDQQATWWGEGK
jgi:hypothetical protein